MKNKDLKAQPPEEFTGIKLTEVPKTAAGFKAIKSTFKHITEEVGLLKGIGLLSKINQKEGFDCPGCAWPDPDEKRAFLSEYCENGAKAIAEEATKKMAELQSSNEALLNEARGERDAMLKDARDVKDKIIAEAKASANVEGDKIIASAKETINLEKLAAITELKNQVASLSIEIAEKILKEELSSEEKQKAIIDNVVKDINLN